MGWMQILMKVLSAAGAAMQGSKPARTQATALSANPNDAFAGAQTQPGMLGGQEAAEGAAPGSSFLEGVGKAVGKGVSAYGGGTGGGGNIGPVASGADYGAMLKGASAGGGGGGDWKSMLSGVLGSKGGGGLMGGAGGGGGGATDALAKIGGMFGGAKPTTAPPAATTPTVQTMPAVVPKTEATAPATNGGFLNTLKAWGGKALDAAGQAQDTYHAAILGPGAEGMTPEQRKAAIWRSRLMGLSQALQGAGPGQVLAARAGAGADSVRAARRYKEQDKVAPLTPAKERSVVIGDNQEQRQIWDDRAGRWVDDGKPYARWKPGQPRASAEKGPTPTQLREDRTRRQAFEWYRSLDDDARVLAAATQPIRVAKAQESLLDETDEEYAERMKSLERSRAKAWPGGATGGASSTQPAPTMMDRAGEGLSQTKDWLNGLLYPKQAEQSVDPAEEERLRKLRLRYTR